MYSTCLFCHSRLGTNEVIEPFPVGRRVAIDSAKGRLWVLCSRCDEWNLSPLEERWEAIEQCERLFRGARLRVSTQQIGLARLAEGLEIVRIGKPLATEFAAWRYGRVLSSRYWKSLAARGANAAGRWAAFAAGFAIWVGAGLLAAGAYAVAIVGGREYWRRRIIASIRGEDERLLSIPNWLLRRSLLVSDPYGDSPWMLKVVHADGTAFLSGKPAERAMGVLLAHVNRDSGWQRDIDDALALIEASGGSDALLARCGELADDTRAHVIIGDTTAPSGARASELGTLARGKRLALEMAVHEQTERRAAEGELESLREAWAEAEEIAAIADDLLLPPSIEEFLQRHRRPR